MYKLHKLIKILYKQRAFGSSTSFRFVSSSWTLKLASLLTTLINGTGRNYAQNILTSVLSHSYHPFFIDIEDRHCTGSDICTWSGQDNRLKLSRLQSIRLHIFYSQIWLSAKSNRSISDVLEEFYSKLRNALRQVYSFLNKYQSSLKLISFKVLLVVSLNSFQTFSESNSDLTWKREVLNIKLNLAIIQLYTKLWKSAKLTSFDFCFQRFDLGKNFEKGIATIGSHHWCKFQRTQTLSRTSMFIRNDS